MKRFAGLASIFVFLILLCPCCIFASGAGEGTDDVTWRYAFAPGSGTYTEITGGTVHGTAANDDQSFTAIPIGFTFPYDAVDYTTVSIQSNGWITMGDTIASSYTPLSTGTTNFVIAAMARDLQGNGTTAELMSLMEGTEPDRVFTVQWKNYKRYGAGFAGDILNFQIKLFEATSEIRFVYGDITPLAGGGTSTMQVGLRGANNGDVNNLMTDATHFWDDPLPGPVNSSTMSFGDTIYPASGQTYTWSLFTGVKVSGGINAGNCPGGQVTIPITVFNVTGYAETFDLSYSCAWPIAGPAATGEIPNEGSETIDVTIDIPWSASAFEAQPYTVTATDPTVTYTGSTSGNALAFMIGGYTDLTNIPAGRGVRNHSVVYWDGMLYKIGGYNGTAQPWLDIYDIGTDTWALGPDMPAARYWIDAVAIDGKIYCAGGYTTTAQDDLYIYDIAAGTWSTSPTLMPANRYNYAGVALNGKYYVIGGYTTTYEASMIAYDPVTDTWDTTLPPMSTTRRYFHAGTIDGKIYVAGGYNVAYPTTGEVFDPAGPAWSPISMGFNWTQGADAVIMDRYLFMGGGYTGSTATASAFAWLYDAVDDMWYQLPAIPHMLYGSEGDSDGSTVWYVSGRMYENGTWSYGEYTTRVEECGPCIPVSNADFTVDPVNPVASLPATFTGTADGSPVIVYEWDFGDGNTGSGQVVDHTYAATGTYTVQMTATNYCGMDTISHDVTVVSGPVIDVTPLLLEPTLCPDSISTDILTICNNGTTTLIYSLSEAIPWLDAVGLKGTVAPGECVNIDISYNTAGLMPGTYTGVIDIDSNDPLQPLVEVDVSLTVAGGPENADFTWDPVSPDFNEEVTFNGTADCLVPVDYSWDFGDGNTGTGQSVTHAFAAAGDYTVVMTATACGLTDTATYVVTVQDCWTVLEEHFEGAFPPAGWTVINNGGNCEWQRNDAFATARPNYAGGDGFCADADSDKCGSSTTMDTELRTMPLDFSGYTIASLDYVTSYNDIAAGGDLADVDVSIDGGTSWINLLRWDEDHSPNGPGEPVSLDLTPYAGQASVMIRFHYHVATYDWWWEVDQVRISGCYIAGAAPDIEVTPLVLTQDLYPDQTADQMFNIANTGLVALNWTLDEGCGTPVDWLSLDPLAGTVLVGGNTDVTVSFDSTGLTAGTYTTTICVDSDDPDEPQVIVDVTLNVADPPLIEVTPASLASILLPDQTDTQQITICNTGAEPLTWNLREANPTSPAGKAAPKNPTDIGYAQDIGYISDNFVTFTLNNWPGQAVVGTSTNAYYGMDFDLTATTLYAIEDTTDQLGTIDLATGAFTPLVSCPPGGGAANWTGLSIDPVDGTFWGSTATDLFTIDPVTGVSTLVGAFGAGGTMIEIAASPSGEMYGHDITSDSIYSINKATGAATLIGPTGYAANYAQGMDFDNSDGTLYIFLYLGSGANVFGTVDLMTGAVTPLASSTPQGEFEGAIKVAADVPWLSEIPTSGTVAPGDCVTVDVTFDSTGLTEGLYTADLIINSNDPYTPGVTVPVSLTVGEPTPTPTDTPTPAPPQIVVTPSSFSASLWPDQTDTQQLSICNAGAEPLTWELSESAVKLSGSKPVSRDLNYYSSRAIFDAAHPGLPVEGFENGSMAYGSVDSIPHPLDQYTSNAYFDPGDILPGIQFWTSPGGTGYEIAVLGEQFAGNPSKTVVANTFTDVYRIVFDPPVTAAGMDIQDFYGNGTCQIDIYDAVGLMATVTSGSSAEGVFWGVDSDVPIVEIVITSLGGGAEGADTIAFGGMSSDFIPWLSESPLSGTVAPGDCNTVDITFDSTGLLSGSYMGNLLIDSNDPVNPQIAIPVDLTVLDVTPTPTWTPTPTMTPTPTITQPPTVTPTPECINDGDVNDDGELTAEDALMAFEFVLERETPTYEEFCAADCNGDGEMTAGDPQGIFLEMLGLGYCVDSVPVYIRTESTDTLLTGAAPELLQQSTGLIWTEVCAPEEAGYDDSLLCIEVMVSARSVPLDAFALKLHFPDNLELMACEAGDVNPGWVMFSSHVSTLRKAEDIPGEEVLNVAAFATDPAAGSDADGCLFRVFFHTIEAGDAEIYLTDLKDDLEAFETGSLTVDM